MLGEGDTDKVKHFKCLESIQQKKKTAAGTA